MHELLTGFVEVLEYRRNTAWLLLRNCLKLISQKTGKGVVTVSELQLGQPRAGRSVGI